MRTRVCICCKQTFSGSFCIRCNFPVVEFLGDKDEGLQGIESVVQSYRDKFLKKIEVGITAYSWKDVDGILEVAEEEMISLGNGLDLWKNEVCLSQLFAPTPGSSVEIPIWGKIDNRSFSRNALIDKNVTDFFKPVMSMEDDMTLKLSLRGEDDTELASAVVSLFDCNVIS